MKHIKNILASSVIGLFAIVVSVSSVFAISSWIQGFETDTSEWFTDSTNITRIASGTNGVTSADGSFHAEVKAGAFTRWGGYESTFPTDGYVTQVDVYLDMDKAVATDKRFDFSSAINNIAGTHRRDFIFSLGTNPAVAGQWLASVSNNAPGWPGNPARNPAVITDSGWYTLKSTFRNNGADVLEVVMEVLDSSKVVVGTWTLSDPSDVIGTTVGGNRYGWFVNSNFDFLAIDKANKFNIISVIGPPTDKNQCKNGGWSTFSNPTFKNQGDCVSFVQSNPKALGNKNK